MVTQPTHSHPSPQQNLNRPQRIRWAREHQTPKLSQRELARRIQVSARTIQLMEIEDGTKRSRYLDKVALALNVSFSWLMNGDGEPFESQQSTHFRWLPIMNAHTASLTAQRKPIPIWLLNNASNDAFLMQLQDDAMAPIMPKGAWLVCDPQQKPELNSKIVFQRNDIQPKYLQVRLWEIHDLIVKLKPYNAESSIFCLPRTKFDVLGVVVGYWVSEK